MLVELQIRDFAIVDRLTVPFAVGFNVMTGETGAGKSIVIDALGAALGARTGPDVIRTGQAAARVEAAFDLTLLDRDARERLAALLEELGFEADDDLLVLTREVQASGRSVARVGGRLTPVHTLQRIGELLVDIHGQGDHLSLFRPSDQLDLLDRYAGAAVLRAEVAASAGRLRSIRRERDALLADQRELARRLDLLRFQVEEIGAANLSPGEDEALEAEQRVLGSAEKLGALSGQAYEALDRVRDAILMATGDLRQIAAIDEGATELSTAMELAGESIDDLVREIRAYQERVELNPERLAEVEERLAMLTTLRRKYGATLEDVITFGERAAQELAALERGEERRDELDDEERDERERLAALAGELSALRQEAAGRLSEDVERELGDLGLARARFSVQIRQVPDPAGVPIAPGTPPVAFDDSGIDRIEFQLAANPGDQPRSLARVASGGETARIMLALKSVLGRLDRVGTLIFDEVDVGIGGRTGHVVGQKLWGLTNGHQVICITHLPQVASFADQHLSIVKLSDADRTGVQIHDLDSAGRRNELAQMLGGATAAAEQNAADLMARAVEWKTAQMGSKR